MNINYKVNIVINSQYQGNVSNAISSCIAIRNYFNVDSVEYNQFDYLLGILKNNYSASQTQLSSTYSGKPVYGYSALTHELVFIANSVNATLSQLNCRWATLMISITNKTIFNKELVLSFEPLTLQDIKSYQQPKSLEGTVCKVILVDPDTLEPVIEHESFRSMARYYEIDTGNVRMAARAGVWEKYLLILEPISSSHEVYRYDAITGEEILPPYKSKAQAARDLNISYKKIMSNANKGTIMDRLDTPLNRKVVISFKREFPLE